MAWYYLDTSALVKRYAIEIGTAWIVTLTDATSGHDLWTVRITGPEMVAALYRKLRMGEVSAAEATRAANDFRTDWQREYQIIEVSRTVADHAMDLAERHNLRGYDAVQLAAALTVERAYRARRLPSLTFISADARQLLIAQAEGLVTEDANSHPP